MLVIKVELWPLGDATRAQTLGIAEIINDGSGDASTGNYTVRLLKWGAGRRTWKTGRVERFPRLRLGPWDLLFRALKGTVEDRNR